MISHFRHNQALRSISAISFRLLVSAKMDLPMNSELSLPVRLLLDKICKEKSLAPPEREAIDWLNRIGEESSLNLLRKISTRNIKNLTGYIIFMAKQEVSNRKTVPPFVFPSSEAPIEEDSLSTYSFTMPTRQWTLHQVALGKLEFRKAFILLSYAGKEKLEELIPVNAIKRMGNLSMSDFESKAWKGFGFKCIPETDRITIMDWNTGMTHLYHCLVDLDGGIRFKGPYLHRTRTHLQRVLGDDNVLMVKFSEYEDGTRSAQDCNNSRDIYRKIGKEGILVGQRRYHFFVYKDGGKEEKKRNPNSSPVKCYFVRTESITPIDKTEPYLLSGKSIHEARCMFMHVHTVSSIAKYMTRFNLILSKTIKMDIDLGSVNIVQIEDECCMDRDGNITYKEDGEPLIHTDGTGYISEDLASKCPKNVFHGVIEKILENSEASTGMFNSTSGNPLFGDLPLLIQCRLFNNGCAVKGTLLLNKLLPPKTIHIRCSMVKVETDRQLSNNDSVNSLEIVGTSNRPKKTNLSRYLIALLSYGGVPKEYFMELLKDALNGATNIHTSKRSALKVALKHGDMDDFLLSRMILCGIPLEEPYLQSRLMDLLKHERKSLKNGKLPVSECYYLMGTVDPTGRLKENEVCIILDNGQISGEVLVYKHPGLHFGDIHQLTASYIKELEDFVGNAKYGIFFPARGPRSLADEIANSDFDGDMYWVSRNPQLLEFFKSSKPWKRPTSKMIQQSKASQISMDNLEDRLFNQFLETRFRTRNVVGNAADSWLSFMDRLLTLDDECMEEKDELQSKLLRLVDIYYDALDASKTGEKVEIPNDLKAEKFPHYMERSNCYISKSILGLIYDQVESFDAQMPSTIHEWILPCFSVEVPQACLDSWRNKYDQYRLEMKRALDANEGESKNVAAEEIIKKYKQMLYNAEEYEQSRRNKEEIFNEVLAIYQITYEYAESQQDPGRCSFVWRVAGRALCELYVMKKDENTIMCSQSVLREIMG